MSKFTCELIKPSHTINFHNGSKQVGLLDFNGPIMIFTGDADESAKVFFDFVAERFAQRLSEKREWAGLTTDYKQGWIDAMPYDPQPHHCMVLVNVIEAALKEKNT
jgi:hypothetical protein